MTAVQPESAQPYTADDVSAQLMAELKDAAIDLTAREVAALAQLPMESFIKIRKAVQARHREREVARLTVEVRALRARGHTYQVIADKLGVSPSYAWTLADEAAPTRTRRRRALVRRLSGQGLEIAQIAEALGIAASTVKRDLAED